MSTRDLHILLRILLQLIFSKTHLKMPWPRQLPCASDAERRYINATSYYATAGMRIPYQISQRDTDATQKLSSCNERPFVAEPLKGSLCRTIHERTLHRASAMPWTASRRFYVMLDVLNGIPIWLVNNSLTLTFCSSETCFVGTFASIGGTWT